MPRRALKAPGWVQRTPRPGLVALGVMCLAAACGSDGLTGSNGPTATVSIVYLAPTSTDPAVASAFPDCVAGVGVTHVHPSWRNFARVEMTAAPPDRWTITLTDAPTNQLLRIRISDPNACAINATGASTENVFANDVRLTQVVDTPGSGIEPGLAFTIDGQGRVTP